MPRRKPVPPGDPRKVVGLVRVSKEEQDLSPEAQRGVLARWCREHGADLVAVFEERITGTVKRGTAEEAIEKRTGLLDALNALPAHGAGALLVQKRDRLARNMIAAAVIEHMAAQAGAVVLTTEGETSDPRDPDAFLRRALKDLLAQYEALVIAARTRAALAVKRGRGERTGDIPLGSRLAADRVHLEENPDEARAIGRMRRLRARGWSYRAIAKRLNLEGPRPRGEKWHPTTILRALARSEKGKA